MRPLDGIRILDFTHVLAGPFCTRVLADMGADVLKVNSRTRVGINAPGGPYYTLFNRNKRALALDMNHDESKAIARELAKKADVVIDNFSMGVLDRWGIGYDAIKPENPGVIYLQMSGMGEGGPWSNFVTYAPTIHALSGITHTTGVPGREDIGIGFSYNDHQAGLHAAVALLAAIEARTHTGTGQRIDISQFEIAVNLLGPTYMDYFSNGVSAEPSENHLPYDQLAPHGCYRCYSPPTDEILDESWIAIVCATDQQWQKLTRLMATPDWTKNPALHSSEGRVQSRELIDAELNKWTQNFDARQLMELLQSHGIPAGVVQSGVDLNENDPQLATSNFIRKIADPHPTMKTTYADKLPINFKATPCEQYRRTRTLGEDNAEVLSEWLNMDESTVREGEEAGYLN